MYELQYDVEADSYISRMLLMVYYDETVQALRNIDSEMRMGSMNIPELLRSVLQSRWIQIQLLVRTAFENGMNPRTKTEFAQLVGANGTTSQTKGAKSPNDKA